MATRGVGDLPLWDNKNPSQQGVVVMDPHYKDLLKRNRVNLCELLDLGPIWLHLRRFHVVSLSKEEEIKFDATRSDQVGRLIDHIQRGPMWRLHAFLRACFLSNNIYVLDILEVEYELYKENNLPSAPNRQDLPMDPGDTMETSSVASSASSSSFSYQDDPEASRIRVKLLQPPIRLIEALAKEVTGSVFLQFLLETRVINTADTDQVQRIQGGQERASRLVGIISRKAGTQLKIFVDILKIHCPSAYKVFEPGEGGRSTSSPKRIPPTAPTFNDRIPTQPSTRLTVCMNDTNYGGFKFYFELKAFMNSGVDVTLVTFENDFNLLHEIIKNGHLDLMKFIQYAGVWLRLYSKRSGHGAGIFSNLTPLEYANALGAKGKAAKDKLSEINEHEQQLLDVDRCVREGNISRFRELKARYKDRVLKSAHKESSVLEYACQSGVLEMVLEVIRTEKELRVRRRSADKAVTVCIILGHHTLLQPLMEYVKVDLNQIWVDGRTPMEYTAANGDVDTFHALRLLGARTTPAVVALAAAKNRLPFLESILSSSVLAFHDINFQDKRGKTAAHFAAEKGHIGVVRLLLEKGLDLTLRDRRRFTILHSAASGGCLEVVEVVLEFSRRQDYLQSILTSRDYYLGADRCYCVKGNDGSNPAWHYVMVDRARIDVFKKKMAEGGINVTIYGEILRSGWGEGPSAEVVKEVEGQYDVVNVETSNLKEDMQALHVAILKNHEGVSLRLIAEMGDVNQPDSFGLTPLHLAAMRGSPLVISALLQKGARKGAADAEGRIPADVAKANEKQEAVQLLVPAGSDQYRENLRKRLKQAYQGLSRENLAGQANPEEYEKSLLRDLEADIKDYLYDCVHEGPIDFESRDPLYP